MMSAEELVRSLGVSAQVIWRRYHQGRIAGLLLAQFNRPLKQKSQL